MTADKITLRFHQRASPASDYEARVPLDATAEEILAWLASEETDAWLGPVARAESYALVVKRVGREIVTTVAEAGVVDGDWIFVDRMTHGAGPAPLDLAAGLAAAKLTIDAAQLGVDAYRARTERIALDLERARLEAGDDQPEPPPAAESDSS